MTSSKGVRSETSLRAESRASGQILLVGAPSPRFLVFATCGENAHLLCLCAALPSPMLHLRVPSRGRRRARSIRTAHPAHTHLCCTRKYGGYGTSHPVRWRFPLVPRPSLHLRRYSAPARQRASSGGSPRCSATAPRCGIKGACLICVTGGVP
jgi:hypothetical protein